VGGWGVRGLQPPHPQQKRTTGGAPYPPPVDNTPGRLITYSKVYKIFCVYPLRHQLGRDIVVSSKDSGRQTLSPESRDAEQVGPISAIRSTPRPRKQDSQVYGQRIGRCSHDFIGDLTSTKEIVDSYGTNYKQNLILQEDADPQILTTDNDRVLLLRINTERILQSAQKDPLIDYATKNLFFHAVLSLCEPAALESSDSSEIVNGTDDSTYYSCTV
jgi:hypothetical protein